MDNNELLGMHLIENKEQYKKDIKEVITKRYIPKCAPKSKNETYEIEEVDTFGWLVDLPKENIQIVFYFYSVGNSLMFRAEIELSEEDYIEIIETDIHHNINEMLNGMINVAYKREIKKIFIK